LVTINYHNREDAMPDTTLTPKSVRIADDEAKWLSAAATKGGVTQNDLLRLALHRLRKELGAASRLKPETVMATAKASKYKLTPPRTAASPTPSARKASQKPSGNGKPTPAKATGRRRGGRSRAA
jgi:hypothetical protein